MISKKKAKIVEQTLFDALGGKDNFAESHVQLIRSDKEDPDHNDLAFARLRISVMDPDVNKAGKLFSSGVVALALASIPGFSLTSPPGPGTPAIRHWPALVGADKITQMIRIGDQNIEIPLTIAGGASDPGPGSDTGFHARPLPEPVSFEGEQTRDMPLGRLFATRSGDKGGNANLGVWARDDTSYGFLFSYLTCERLKALLPDMAPYQIERYDLPNLRAVNFYIRGVLGHGVAASMRSDPQAKTLGEYLRAKNISVPLSILNQ